MEDMFAMQQAAYERVRRMQERSRKLCGNTRAAAEPCKPKAQDTDERWLLLILALILCQNDGNPILTVLLISLIV